MKDMNLSNEEKARIFAMYYGCECIFSYNEQKYIVNGTVISETIDPETCGGSLYKLILKDLSDITDEELKELWIMLGKNPEFEGNPNFPEHTVRGYLFEYFEDRNRKFPTTSQMLDWEENIICVDFLRSKGYALPYKSQSLFDLGIAIKNPIDKI